MKEILFCICSLLQLSIINNLLGQTCPTTLMGNNPTISSPCTGDINIINVGNGANNNVTIDAAVTGNITLNDQQVDFTITSSGSVSGNVVINDQQVDLVIQGNIGGNLDINNQQINLDLSADIGGILDLGQQQVDVDVTGNSTVGSIVTSGQQNDFIVDNGDAGVKIVLTVENDVCVEDQQNSIQTSSDDEVIILGTVKCTGTGCDQFNFVGNISASSCSAESGNFCTDADLTVDPALPIELLSFDINPLVQFIEINWSTASELNNDFFTIERSRDPFNFEPIATIQGAGNSSQILSYTYEDERPLSGISYYRLRQTDFDGTTEAFDIRAVEFNGNIDPGFKVLKNPSSEGQLQIFNSLDDDRYSCLFYSTSGVLLQQQKLQRGENNLPFKGRNQNLIIVQVRNPLGQKVLNERVIIN